MTRRQISCPYCERIMRRALNVPLAASRDHKIPLSRGGTDTADNIEWVCRQCNSDKGSLLPEEYRAVRAGAASRLDKSRKGRGELPSRPTIRVTVGNASPRSPFESLSQMQFTGMVAREFNRKYRA